MPILTSVFAPMIVEAEPADDAALFRGKWAMTAMEENGRTVAPDDLRGQITVVRGDRYTQFRGAAVLDGGTFRLFPESSPKQAEFTITDGPAKGKVQLGIYEIDENQVRFCLARPGDRSRPGDFLAGPGSNRVLIVMKRLE
jgi:uncharacterized protein (TIGR03067 family)